MKLARIQHDRCGEWAATSIVWIPEDMTQRKFENAVDRAQEAYLAYLKEFNTANPPPNSMTYNIGWHIEKNSDEYPDSMTLGEAKALYEEQKKAHKDWQEQAHKAKNGLLPFLEAEGIRSFWGNIDENGVLEADLYWGHNHGQSYDYSETDPDISSTYKEPESG